MPVRGSLVAALLMLSGARLFAAGLPVDLNLVITVDCSYSVGDEEYRLQMQGTGDAFLHPDVLSAISEGQNGSIAVTVLQWAGGSNNRVVLPWTVISGAQDGASVAAQISNAPRQVNEGATSISSAIFDGISLLRDAPTSARRQVIDVAADGENNIGDRVELARNAAVSAGITVNGLTILNEDASLHLYFRYRVVGGSNAFVEVANSFQDYATAIRRKLLREIRPPLS